MKRSAYITFALLLLFSLNIRCQPWTTGLMNEIKSINSRISQLLHRFDILEKKIDDVQWYNKVGDIAYIDKVYMTGPPLVKEKNPTGQGAGRDSSQGR